MKRTVKTDPFFADQPEKSFIGELTRPLHREKPYDFGERACRDGEPTRISTTPPLARSRKG